MDFRQRRSEGEAEVIVRAESIARHNANASRIEQIIGDVHRTSDLFAVKGASIVS